MKTSRRIALLLGLAVLLTGLTGCSKKSDDGKKRNAKGEIIIRAVTETTYPPYSYVNEKNILTGYDVEVIRAINERLKGYDIQIEGLAADAALLALQSHTTDIFFDQMGITESRLEKFHFSAPYFEAVSSIIVKKGRTDIQTLADLEGKRVGAYVGDVQSQYLEKYNEETAKTPIEIVYIDTGTEEATLLDLQNGKYDAHLTSPVVAKTIIDGNKLDLDIVETPVFGEDIGIMFFKDETGANLKALIDPIIIELRNDGTLSRLAKEFTGFDYAPTKQS